MFNASMSVNGRTECWGIFRVRRWIFTLMGHQCEKKYLLIRKYLLAFAALVESIWRMYGTIQMDGIRFANVLHWNGRLMKRRIETFEIFSFNWKYCSVRIYFISMPNRMPVRRRFVVSCVSKFPFGLCVVSLQVEKTARDQFVLYYAGESKCV